MGNATEADIEMVQEILGSYCDSDVSGGRDRLRQEVAESPPRPYVESLRRGLAFVIERKLLSAAELERLTNYTFDSDRDAQMWLEELQRDLFGTSPS